LNVRNIERGSLILKIIDEKLIFLIPRGNLELIYPRISVIIYAKNDFLKGRLIFI